MKNKLRNSLLLLTLFILAVLNEFTLVLLDTTPPLSPETVFRTRVFNVFVVSVALIVYSRKYWGNWQLKSVQRAAFVVIANLTILVVLDVFLSMFGFGYPRSFEEEGVQRYPSPYDHFHGQPNVLDHNEMGYRGEFLPVSELTPDQITIAFFGGSTGYEGDPTISEEQERLLNMRGFPAVVYNFSSVSSNHSQHIHRLLGNTRDYRFDMVLFYGGVNESLQYYDYDTRPGYPFKFYIRDELAPLMYSLLRYSSIFGTIDIFTGMFSGIGSLREYRDNNIEDWQQQIIQRYEHDLDIAQELTLNLATPNICSNSVFLSVLQPANPREETKDMWNSMINYSDVRAAHSNRYNLSGVPVAFLDVVHVDQE
jgi:hypothetical protein